MKYGNDPTSLLCGDCLDEWALATAVPGAPEHVNPVLGLGQQPAEYRTYGIRVVYLLTAVMEGSRR